MELFLLIIFFFCFVIFLYYLHSSAKDDFVLMRKNVSLEQLFDVAFLTGFAALFTSRLLYVFFHFSTDYLNPLVFFGLPYFPGLSISGALIGAGLFLLLYGRRKRLPASRIADFFSIAFLLSVPIGFLAAGILNKTADSILFYTVSVLSLLLFFFFAKMLYPKLLGGQYKDGTITYLFLMNFPLVFLLSQIISRATLKQFYFTLEDGIYVGIFLVGIVLYMRQEHLPQRRKNIQAS